MPSSMLRPDIANLALAGDGASTGLEIIRDSDAKPTPVLVETNLLLHSMCVAMSAVT
jgi:hypothetical protein